MSLFSSLLFKHGTGNSSQNKGKRNTQEKGKKGTQTGKKEVKLSPCTDDMTIYKENSKDSDTLILRLIL